MVNGRGDTPNQHDVLTGTQPNGTAFPGTDDKTCGNWTKSGDGSAIVGHIDRDGIANDPVAVRYIVEFVACVRRVQRRGAEVRTGGAGLLYCFAAK